MNGSGGYIEFSGVSKQWPNGGGLIRVDLHLGNKAPWYLLGGNGSGKSTLLRLAAGIVTPDHGSLHCGGMPDRHLSTHLKPSFGGQPKLNAKENLRRALALRGRLSRRALSEAQEYLEAFALDDQSQRMTFDKLSQGQRQKLALAATFAGEPDLVLLDEPTTFLDEDAVNTLSALCRQVSLAGAVVLAATHSRDFAKNSSRVLRIHEGKIQL